MSYAIVNPNVPTQEDKKEKPELEKLNSDNPFLRASDPSLITQVVVARMLSSSTVELLLDKGFSDDYTVARAASSNGFIVDISAIDTTPGGAMATTAEIGKLLVSELEKVQKVNGADDIYLFSPLKVDGPNQAQELFSSRLRSLIIVGIGGAILLFGTVSLARSIDQIRIRNKIKNGQKVSKRKKRLNTNAKSDEETFTSEVTSSERRETSNKESVDSPEKIGSEEPQALAGRASQ